MDPEGTDPVGAADRIDTYRRAVNPFRLDVLEAVGWPLLYTDAEGDYVTAADGRRFLDLIAQNGAALLGHRNPRVVEALTAALREGGPFTVPIGLPGESGPLAARLCEVAGTTLARAYFCTGGSEANETAMKFAMAATGRHNFVGFDEGFHGFTLGPLPLAGHDYWRLPLPGWSPAGRVRVPFGDAEALEKALAGDDVAAVLVEPVQGLGGARDWDPEALRAVARSCAAHGTLLIADEVLSGIGRTGQWFGFQHAGLEPDLVVTSKGLSAGIVPIATVLMTEAVHRAVYASPTRAYIHNSTFEGHLLGTLAGLTVLDIIEQEGILDRVNRISGLLRTRLDELVAEDIGIRAVRGRGLLIGVQIEGIADPDNRDGAGACIPLLLQRGILIESSAHAPTWLRLTPPLTIAEESVEKFAQALRECALELASRR